MFYAGEAYEALNDGKSPEEAIEQSYQAGYRQEKWHDYVRARHSYFSYEDLPSDWHGANFAAKYFDSKSDKTLGEQIKNYFNSVLNSKQPTDAPNYHMLPKEDTGKHPGFYNYTKEPYDFKIEIE